jgi:threonine-phosphate decarboxylase
MKEHDAGALKKYLVHHHSMLIRDASNFHGLTPQHFRVAAQTPVENDALVAAIRNFIESRNG